jgi:3,4-dihydroxy 2-butanone 4-phosphate synthase/GTP cyclohydrolase II
MAITASTTIQTKFGPFSVSYHKFDDQSCVSFSFGDLTKGTPVIRIHSACLFGEAFSSLHCDCDQQLTQTMQMIQKSGAGSIIYSYQEGRGIGLENKIKSMEIERVEHVDTVEAFKKLGFDKADLRTYAAEVSALKDLSVSKNIISFSGNPNKKKALEDNGFKIVEEIEIKDANLSQIALKEKSVKKEKLGYSYKEDPDRGASI